ncbi:MAG: hypothetical protein ACRESV_11070, partial [Nevskiales bacterium]
MTGFFSLTATFGQGQANQTTLTSAGSRDVFVATYDSVGLLQWAKGAGAGGTNLDQGTSVAVDGSGSLYAVGYFNGSATFGPGEANQTTLTSLGGIDIFVAKFGGNSGSVNDTTAPALAITSHANNQTTTVSPITLSGTASDASTGGNGILSVTVNGVAAAGGTASGSGTANWSRSVTLNSGPNTITVVGRDNSAAQNSTTVQINVNYSTGTQTAGLVAAYGFNETSGSTVGDDSGNNNAGTLGSGITRTTAGKFGGALVFNGTSYVNVPHAASLNLTTAMTLEAWVFPTVTPGNWSTIFLKERPGGFTYSLYTS